MAESSMAVDATAIEELANKDANDATAVDGNFDEIISKFNSSLETTTGHYHDGVDAKPVYSGATGWSAEDLFMGVICGCFGGGEI